MTHFIKAGLSLIALPLAFIFSGSLPSSAQVQYTDIIPDMRIWVGIAYPGECIGRQYQFDIDRDGNADFILDAQCNYQEYPDSVYVSITSAGPDNYFVADQYVDTLNFGDVIDESSNWINGKKYFYIEHQHYGTYLGTWTDLEEHFVGLKMIRGSSVYYGWLRMVVFSFAKAYFRDYSIQFQSGESIFAGEGLKNFALNIRVADVGDQKNASDIAVNFDPAYNDTGILEYRIMAVNTAHAGTFTVDSANTVTADQYTSVPASQTPDTLQLDATDHSTDGQPITNRIDYSIFILSSYEDASYNVLSYPVRILLRTQAPAVAQLVSTDIGNTGNGSDVLVSFNKIFDEDIISEYRIMVVPEDQLASFTLDIANKVVPDKYIIIPPSGSDISVQLQEQTTDIEGYPIIEENGYYVFVLSVADGILADMNALSEPSNLLILSDPGYMYAGQTDKSYIHFTDLEPDIEVSAGENQSESLNLDLDGDGTDDYAFYVYSYMPSVGTYGTEAGIQGKEVNYVILSTGSWIHKCNFGDPLPIESFFYRSSGVFSYQNYDEINGLTQGGFWPGKDKYAGLAMFMGYDTIIGWVKVTGGGTKISIDAYAWMNYPVHMGDTMVYAEDGPYAFPVPANDQFYIISHFPSQRLVTHIYDLSGKLMYSFNSILLKNEPLAVDVSFLREGAYILKMVMRGKVCLRKIIIMR